MPRALPSLIPLRLRPPACMASLRCQLGLLLFVLLSIGMGCSLLWLQRIETLHWQSRQEEQTISVAQSLQALLASQQPLLRALDLYQHQLTPESAHAILADFLQQYPFFLEIAWLQPDGSLLASKAITPAEQILPHQLPQKSWFKKTQSGHFQVRVFTPARPPGQSSFLLAVPMAEERILVCRILSSLLHTSLSTFPLTTFFLVDAQGTQIVTDPREPPTASQQHNITFPWAQIAAKEQWSGEYLSSEGQSLFCTARMLPETSWHIVSVTPLAEVPLLTLQAFWFFIICFILLTLFFLAVSGIIMTHQLGYPLEQLEQAFEQLACGETKKLHLEGASDLDRITTSFNTMVTRLKQRERELGRRAQELDHNRARYQTILEEQSELVCRYLNDGTITFANKAFCRFFEIQQQDIPGKNFSDLLPRHILEQRHLQLTSLNRAQPLHNDEFEYIRKNGEQRWVAWRDQAIYDHLDRFQEFASVGRDITERKRVELALIESQEQLDLALHAANIGLWDLRFSTETLLTNDVWQTMLGFEPEEDLGIALTKWSTKIHPEDLEHVLTVIQDHAEGKTKYYRTENRVQCKDGQYKWILSIGKYVEFDPDQQPTRAIGITMDIDELRSMQHQLIHAKEEAEAANRLKSQFLANISHEIQTPMNAIIGMAELAMQTHEASKRHRFLSTLRHSAESLLGLLNDILDFSKMEAGQLELRTTTLKLRDSIDTVMATLQAFATEKDLALRCHIEKDIPEILMGDEMRLRQIFLNLVGNAIKFTHNGSVTLTIKGQEQAGKRWLLTCTVKDTGIGIPPDKLPIIFDNFEQADNSSTRKYQGTGLGLAISRQLIQRMGGEVSVESQEGQGTTFHFTVMLAAAAPPKRSSSLLPSAKSPPNTEPHILLVDDNEVNLEVASLMLASDYTVSTAENGIDALATLAREEIDLVLMDIQMPIMDGLHATRVIRTLEQGNQPEEIPENLRQSLSLRLSGGHLPIVAMTAHAMREDKQRCLDAGMDNYISKPFQPHQLMGLMHSLVPHYTFTDKTGKSQGELSSLQIQVRHYLQDVTQLADEQIDQLLQTACKNLALLLERAEEEIQRQNYPQLSITAHTLKGVLLQCGLQDLADTAQQIHAQGQQPAAFSASQALRAIRQGVKGLLGGQLPPSTPKN